MSNMQNNFYGIPWQQSSQQMNYAQFPPPAYNQHNQPSMPFDSSSRFSAPPPPPPPENNQSQTSDSMQHQNMNARKQNNFQGFNNSNRGQQSNNNNNNNNNNRQQNFRGNRRGGGNARGTNRFSGDNSHMQNSNNSNNFNDSNQVQNNFGNTRGKNNRNNRGNWNKNKNNPGANSEMNNTSGPVKFAHEVRHQPPINLNVPQQQKQQNTTSPCTAANNPNVTNLEQQFRDWEDSFIKWQEENKDHPDRQQYDLYKKQFIQFRQELLARIQKLKEKSISNPPMTDEQIKFSSEWTAGDPNKDSASSEGTSKTLYDPTTSANQLPPAFVSNSDLPASSILFGCSSTNSNDAQPQAYTNDKFDDENIDCFEHAVMDPNYSNFNKNDKFVESTPVIPGLGLFSSSDTINEKNDQTESEDTAQNEPIIPTFSRTKTRYLMNISELLEEPGRSNRPDKILIMIRGAPGSGKHYLANLIYEKEREMNDRCEIYSIRKFIINNKYDPRESEEYDRKQLNECREMMQEGYINFAIVVLNGCGIKHFNRISHMSYNSGHFECFSIEIHQKPEICLKNDINNRGITDIRLANEDLARFSTPIKIKLLNPTSLYYSNEKQTEQQSNLPDQQDVAPFEKQLISTIQQSSSTATSEPNSSNAVEVTEDFAKKMAQILQNENVMQLLQQQMTAQINKPNPPIQAPNIHQPPPIIQHQIPQNIPQNVQQQAQNIQRPMNMQHSQNNMQFQNIHQHQSIQKPMNMQQTMNRMPIQNFRQPPPQKQFNNPNNFSVEDCPIFKPAKVIDYNHIHKQTFEESLMEFKIFRTIDYNHLTSRKLFEYVKEIDVEKIIEKRKAIALRKKILEYLRNAERPEDTVSNPKYPRNWEVIARERPPRKSKRRKRLTAKIKRILMIKSRDENSWMTRGYVKDDNEQMDLEAISSDDSEVEDVRPAKIARIEAVDEYQDEYKDIFKTIPDFKRFNHPKIVQIKSLLWMPERKFRPSKILIIMRGAPGSGKSHLVQLIKRKESEAGNASDIRILSIDDYYLTEDDEDRNPETRLKLTQSYLENLQKHLRKTIVDNLHNFIIIDAENVDLNSYSQFHQIGTSMGFSVYTIELYQTQDICMKQCKRQISSDEIAKSIELLNKYRIPKEHTLLIPTALYEEFKCFVNPLLSNKAPEQKRDDSIKNYENYLVQTIDDDYLELKPHFNWHNRDIIDINEILENPGRSRRNKNIAILMRGPGGSGKNELASAILNKERSNGNENTIFVSVEEFYINETTNKYEFNNRDLDAIIQKLIRKLLELMRSKNYNFIIVDVETGDFSHYMQIYELLSKQNKCYTIETYQDATICADNDIHKRSLNEIEGVLEEMTLNPTPDDHILLDASIFYKHSSNTSALRPLKSALKTSPNTSFNIENSQSNDFEKIYESNFSRSSLYEKFQAKFNQRIFVKGNFVQRNSSPPSNLPEFNWFNVAITDFRELLEEPSRLNRPENIVIFIRGAPASGKTYLTRLIERKEIEKGNEKNVHLLSIDECFETVKFRETEIDGQFEKYIECNADESLINNYMQQLNEKFTNILSNKNSIIVLDGDFCDLKYYNEMWKKAVSNGYSCYAIELNQDDNTCLKYNDHKWNEKYILERNKMMQEIQTPDGHTLLDPEYLYHEYNYEFHPQGNVFTENYHMDISDEEIEDFSNDSESNELSFGKFKMSAQKSKWDDFETPDIERLDGIKTKTSQRVTMADYLQTDDANEWSMRPSKSGKKRVRWADIEEKKAQEHMRKIGFIVGHTDWNRMTDESDGKSALEKTKFIEPRQKK